MKRLRAYPVLVAGMVALGLSAISAPSAVASTPAHPARREHAAQPPYKCITPDCHRVGVAQSSATTAVSAGSTVPMQVERAVDALGRRSYPSVYGGIVIINNRTQIAVYLTQRTPDVEAAFGALAPEGMLVFRPTSNSLQRLDAIHQQLEGQWQSLIDQGIDVVEFGPDIHIGQEDIGVENLTSAQVQTLGEMFGAGDLNVYNVTPAEAQAGQLLNSRIYDTAPYNGGDAIADIFSSGCTSGFGIEINGNPRLVSAGHCYSVGESIFNLRCPSATSCSGSGNKMGDVTQNGLGAGMCDCNGNYLDSLVFTGCNGSGTCGGSDLIWTGAIGDAQRATVSGKGAWFDGDTVCESGSYGGEKCDFVVVDINFCTSMLHPDSYFCHLTEAEVTSANCPGAGTATCFPHHGDSGGPVFRRSSAGPEIIGTVTGRLLAPYFLFYFTGIDAILNKFNACLRTSSGCVS